ncbi:MAG: tRNA (adenosine(37)-N6)-dimethylallyltransferase MiaA [Lachnospiraceae bacterium]|nr:tRNA (adenosine(37)-N6)-dimethylallyltransferase MiaA [Lachnospiraceae bacterium]
MQKKLIILTGPTAAGKTKLSIALAKAINGEIISADSVQVYRHMDIGSAKIRPEEMQGVKHYLVDILEPTEEFNIVLFQKYAKQAIAEIYGKGKVPIIVGGTGFYIQSVLYDIDFQESAGDTALRGELEVLACEKGAEYLHDILKECDPQAAQEIHANNIKRVIRAIEFNRQTGRKISEHNASERIKQSAYDSYYFVLTDVREKLYKNIEMRVDMMIQDGLINEVRHLMEMGCKRNSTAMQGIGYKEILSYLMGDITLDEAVRTIKRDTRHFAKRQLTWFRRERDVIWIEKDKFAYDDEKMLNYIEAALRKGKNNGEHI